MEPDAQEELAYLKSAAIPAHRKYTVKASAHTFDLDLWLDMLELRLLEIGK